MICLYLLACLLNIGSEINMFKPTKTLKFYVKVFKTSYFLNPLMDLVYIWYNYRCWSKILMSPNHTTAYDL